MGGAEFGYWYWVPAFFGVFTQFGELAVASQGRFIGHLLVLSMSRLVRKTTTCSVVVGKKV